VAVTVSWDESTFKPNGELFDLAVIRIDSNLVNRSDVDVTPLVFKYDRVPHKKGAEEPLDLETKPWISPSPEDIRNALDTAKKQPPKARIPLVCAGQPGFLMFPSRKKNGVAIGSETYALVSQKYFDADVKPQPFAIFLRRGVLSFCGVDGTDADSDLQDVCEPFLIACQSSKGNSGAPVFVNVKTSCFDGSVCETPHLLGVLTGSVNATGPAQTLNVTVFDTRENPLGQIRDTPSFTENAGLSVVWPVDYLARILIDYEAQR
jgi:hypothetical protein